MLCTAHHTNISDQPCQGEPHGASCSCGGKVWGKERGFPWYFICACKQSYASSCLILSNGAIIFFIGEESEDWREKVKVTWQMTKLGLEPRSL